ncbi:MAG: VWA domain-containing protein [Planctomycetaceae bacterium]|nr:VWA domain-containing protein [Planctomycetaceae bacterium]
MFDVHFTVENVAYFALGGVALVALIASFGKRELPRKAWIGATFIRCAVIAALAFALGRPVYPPVEKGQTRDIVLLHESIEPEVALRAKLRWPHARHVALRDDGSVETYDSERSARTLESLIARASLASPVPMVHAHVSQSMASRVAAVLEASRLPYTLDVLPQVKAPNKEEALQPSVELAGPAVVIPGEPFTLRVIPTGTQSGVKAVLRMAGREIGLERQVDGTWISERLVLAGQETAQYDVEIRRNEQVIASASRTVAATVPENIGVLSTDEAVLRRYQTLLPTFTVAGYPVEHKTDGFDTCRAVIAPLDTLRTPPEWVIPALQDYANDGGCVLFTGLTQEQYRMESPRGWDALLPVTLIPPKEPDKPPSGDTKLEKGESNVAKISMVFVIDHSGSMIFKERLSQSKAAIVKALESIHDFDRMGVLLFTTDIEWVDGEGISDVIAGKREGVQDYLKRNPPRQQSETDIYHATRTALDHIKKETSAVKVIVVVSDGFEALERNPQADHPALRREAIENKVTVATIRVGVKEIGDAETQRAERVMSALATADDLAFGVLDNKEAEIPKLIIGQVEYAYRRYDELQAGKVPDKPKDPKTDDQKPTVPFVPGTLKPTLTGTGIAIAGALDLPLIGAEGVEIAPKPGTLTLMAATDEKGDGLYPAALVGAKYGLGQVLYLRLPLDATNAGSWLESPLMPATLLDRTLKHFGRSRLSELSPLLGVRSLPGEVHWSGAGVGLQAVGITNDGKEGRLEVVNWGDRSIARIPDNVAQVEIRTTDDVPLARTSALAAVAKALEISPSFPVVENRVSQSATALPITPPVPATGLVAALLALVLLVMPFERYLRRV